MRYSDLWPAAERESHLEALQGVAEDAYQSSQSWHHAKANGELIEVVTFGRRVTFADRAAFLVTVMDVTERRRAEARIAHMAHHDALTDLPNRTVFGQRLNDALVRARRDRQWIAVLWIDLDHFKSINDSFGHAVGDRLLKAAAQRLRKAGGECVLVARLGGDEFAVLLEQVATPNGVGAVAERLIETLSVPFEFDGTEMTVGTSVGIALYPGDGETADEMLRNADLALYRAKADGRGTHHFFEPEMDRQAQKRRALERDLRKGLTRGEFELYYQPLIDLASERITAFESLLRWNHPERGMVPPAEFISVAEETGLSCRSASGCCRPPAARLRAGPTTSRSPSTCRRCNSATAIWWRP